MLYRPCSVLPLENVLQKAPLSLFLFAHRFGFLSVIVLAMRPYPSSGFCPSCASHLHSVTSICVNVALNEESSGLQA